MTEGLTSVSPTLLRRLIAATLVGYLLALALTVFWPSSAAPASGVRWVHARLMEVGVSDAFTPSMVQFVSNIVLFVPLTFLASLLWQRRSWLVWTLVGFAGSLFIEITQMLLLSGRSPTVRDVVANTLGALVGVLLARPIHSRLRPTAL